jgi:hypothetical protein
VFKGVLPSGCRSVVSRVVDALKPRRVIIPCAGNFSIEGALRASGYAGPLASGDVSAYSSFLGWFFADGEADRHELTIRRPDLQHLTPWTTTAAGRAALLVWLLHVSQYADRSASYYADHWEYHMTEAEGELERCRLALTAKRTALQPLTYRCGDLREAVAEPGADELLVLDPPFYAGGYSRMFRWIEESIAWDKPRLGEWNPEKDRAALLENLTRRTALIILREPVDCAGFRLVGRVGPLGQTLWRVYASGQAAELPLGLADQDQESTCAAPYPLLGDDHEITEASILAFAPLPSNLAQHYGDLFLRKAHLHQPMRAKAWCVVVDGLFAGQLIVSQMNSTGLFSLWCDLAVPSRRYRRLARLVLMAALSQEFRDLVEETHLADCHLLRTTVFSAAPVSMKYRGLFELTERKAWNEAYHRLIYESEAGRWPLKEVIGTWLRKYERTATTASSGSIPAPSRSSPATPAT